MPSYHPQIKSASYSSCRHTLLLTSVTPSLPLISNFAYSLTEKIPEEYSSSVVMTPSIETAPVHEADAKSRTPASQDRLFPALPPYKPPSGLCSYLPVSVVPYAELMRIHKPAGYYAFYFPHLFGTLYAATVLSRPLSELLRVNILFIIGSVLLRGAACTWNDTLDAAYDRKVARCCHRPVARGAVSSSAAYGFTLAQAMLAACVLYQLPRVCTGPATVLVATMALYPLAKRVTNYPQVVLGFSLALGQLVGAAGMGMDLWSLTNGDLIAAMGCLYLSNVVNAVTYDAVYAHQDLEDDLKAGVKSVAVAWRSRTKPILGLLSVFEVCLLGAAGFLFGMRYLFFASAVLGTSLVLGSMIWAVRLDVPKDCWQWFQWTIWLTGGTVSGGLFAEYLSRATP